MVNERTVPNGRTRTCIFRRPPAPPATQTTAGAPAEGAMRKTICPSGYLVVATELLLQRFHLVFQTQLALFEASHLKLRRM